MLFDCLDVVCVFFGSKFKADKDCFFELTYTLTSDAEEITDLLERLFAIAQPKTTRDDFSFSFTLNTSNNALDGAAGIHGGFLGCFAHI